MAQLDLDTSTLEEAHMARHAVFAGINTSTGWLAPVVNPLDWTSEGQESPEGQSFTLLLAASYRDYNNATGQTAPPKGSGGSNNNGGGKSAASTSRDLPPLVTVSLLAMVVAFLNLV